MRARSRTRSSRKCARTAGSSPEDLKAYRVVEREPVRGNYRGYEIASMPPPSSGGAHLIEMLNILEGFDLKARRPQQRRLYSPAGRGHAARLCGPGRHMGDPDFEGPGVRSASEGVRRTSCGGHRHRREHRNPPKSPPAGRHPGRRANHAFLRHGQRRQCCRATPTR